jgi:hypothetical protein
MTREEPSLETLWLQNIRTMDKVQKIDRSNTALPSKHLEINSKEYKDSLHCYNIFIHYFIVLNQVQKHNTKLRLRMVNVQDKL